MKTCTNNNNTAAVRTNSLRSTFSIALAGLFLALTPIASFADGSRAVITGTNTTIIHSTQTELAVRPVQVEDPADPRQIAADYNHSGMVDSNDLFDFLSGWFAGKISADTNLNGVLEIQDVLDYVSLWLNSYGTRGSENDPRQ